MMALFDLRVWMGIAIAALVALLGVQQVRVSNAKANTAKAEQAYTTYKLEVSETTRKLQAENDRKHAEQLTREKEAADAARTREAKLRTDAAGAQSELARLRDAITRTTRRDPVSQPGTASKADPASTIGDVLAECSAAYAEVARAADGHASDVETLTASWPK